MPRRLRSGVVTRSGLTWRCGSGRRTEAQRIHHRDRTDACRRSDPPRVGHRCEVLLRLGIPNKGSRLDCDGRSARSAALFCEFVDACLDVCLQVLGALMLGNQRTVLRPPRTTARVAAPAKGPSAAL